MSEQITDQSPMGDDEVQKKDRPQPQDRKPKKKATPERPADDDPTRDDGLKVKVRGVDITINTEVLDDFELLTDMGRIDDGDPTRSGTLLLRVVGQDQFRLLMDATRDVKTGRVPTDVGVAVLFELFGALEAAGPNS